MSWHVKNSVAPHGVARAAMLSSAPLFRSSLIHSRRCLSSQNAAGKPNVINRASPADKGTLMQRVIRGDLKFADACKDPNWDPKGPGAIGSTAVLSKLENGIIFSGSANPGLAGSIAKHLGTPLGSVNLGRFADGEVRLQFLESLRDKDIFIVQPTSTPVNENLMELLLMISTCKRASAKRITAVIPYYGYCRQDRKLSSRVPISAADVSRMLEAMGVDRVISADLHCGQIQGFFGPHVPVDNLESQLVALEYFAKKNLVNPIVVSPDAGGVYRVKKFQEGMRLRGVDCGVAMLIKQRSRPNEIERMDLVGRVEGSDAIIIDDIIDTAGTLTQSAEQLKIHGARNVYAFATHGLFNGPAIKRIEASDLKQVLVTDSTQLPEIATTCSKIEQASISLLVAEAIRRINNGESLQQLFLDGNGPNSM